MFERFTTQAREVVVGAQQEARMLGHGFIGTEHILLSLMNPSSGASAPLLGDAGLRKQQVSSDIVRLLGESTQLGESDAAALEAIGIDLGAVRAKIEEYFGPGALDPAPPVRRRGLFRRKVVSSGDPATGHLPFTPRAKKVRELSLRESVQLGHKYIGSEHIVLACCARAMASRQRSLPTPASTSRTYASGRSPRWAARPRQCAGRCVVHAKILVPLLPETAPSGPRSRTSFVVPKVISPNVIGA